jgi:aromatic ring hydroxylase
MDFSMPTKKFHEEATEYAIWFAIASDTSKFEALSFSMLRPKLKEKKNQKS